MLKKYTKKENKIKEENKKKSVVPRYITFLILSIILGGIFTALTSYAATIAASNISYSNTTSGLTATNAQAAIDEIYSGSLLREGKYVKLTSSQCKNPMGDSMMRCFVNNEGLFKIVGSIPSTDSEPSIWFLYSLSGVGCNFGDGGDIQINTLSKNSFAGYLSGYGYESEMLIMPLDVNYSFGKLSLSTSNNWSINSVGFNANQTFTYGNYVFPYTRWLTTQERILSFGYSTIIPCLNQGYLGVYKIQNSWGSTPSSSNCQNLYSVTPTKLIKQSYSWTKNDLSVIVKSIMKSTDINGGLGTKSSPFTLSRTNVYS